MIIYMTQTLQYIMSIAPDKLNHLRTKDIEQKETYLIIKN